MIGSVRILSGMAMSAKATIGTQIRLRIATSTAKTSGEVAAATAGAHAGAAVGAVFVAGAVWLNGDGPFGAELVVA